MMETNNSIWKNLSRLVGMVNGKWKTEIFIFILLTIPSLAQSNQVAWSSFSSGFGVSNSTNTRITSSIGVSFEGSTSNGTSSISSGFLANYGLIITDISDEPEIIPIVYKLNQNYPNPFNPSTIINYQIPEESFVALKIYDVLGNEILTLVNEEKIAGSYKVSFDAGKLASGVYIYQLKAGTYVDTKKMILLR
ncbi:MAG: T9SS type A sorting domain-containing protein [Ignavibacteria bacterium]